MKVVHSQSSKYSSPWPFRVRVKMLLWDYFWVLLCRWTPKPFNPFRVVVLRLFGAKINGSAFIHQRARISHPWNCVFNNRSCVGDGATLYSLGEIFLGEGATVAQNVYLCTGSHDFSVASMPLTTNKITIGEHAFLGVGALVLPGVSIGDGAIVGAASVVVRDVPAFDVVAGNPAKSLGYESPISTWHPRI